MRLLIKAATAAVAIALGLGLASAGGGAAMAGGASPNDLHCCVSH